MVRGSITERDRTAQRARLAALIDGAAALEDSGAPHADPSFFSEELGKTVVRSTVSDAR